MKWKNIVENMFYETQDVFREFCNENSHLTEEECEYEYKNNLFYQVEEMMKDEYKHS